MFHANNRGLPWCCASTGAKMVYSQVNDAEAICGLLDREKVTHVAGVPTVRFSLFQHLDETGKAMPPFRHALSGGSAAAAASPVANGVDVARLNFRYRTEGDNAPWRPVSAFADSAQVFIEFPARPAKGNI